ncbi:MAG: hypothetical protein ABL993_04080 [Vicinamibacterales bacterium]
MTLRLLCGLALWACAASASANPGPSRQVNEAARASSVFTDRVQAYVTLLKDLDGSVTPLRPTTNPEQIAGPQHALAEKIALARRDSRQGAIFTPDVAEQFREIIRDTLQGPNGRNMRRTILEGDSVTPTILRVNGVYPEELPLGTMPPTLLRRLPVLPMELAYRIIGRALVLKDVKTNLIVDILPDALPRIP